MVLNESKINGDEVTALEYNTVAATINDITDNGLPQELLFNGTTFSGLNANSLTTTERDAILSPNTGALIWNETTTQLEYYNGTVWGAVDTTLAGALLEVVDDLTPQLGGDLDVNGKNVGGVTPAELTHLSGVTSDIQTQLNAAMTDVANDLSPTLGGDLDAVNQDIQNIKLAEFNSEVDNGNSGAADTVDWGAGNKQKSTLTGNVTYTFTAPSGPCNLVFKMIQDGVGTRTATFPATVKWAGGTAPTLSTASGSVDIVTFYYDGTNYYGVASLDFQ